VEDKSNIITDEAQRGLQKRLEKTVEMLVVNPTLQGQQFAALLRNNPGKHTFKTKRGTENVVDSTDIRRYLMFGVTFELFGLLSLRGMTLRNAGLIAEEIDPAVVLALVDLETVLKTLDSDTRRFHYLSRRIDLEQQSHLTGDEFDLLS
jgi:hypothetical protein